MPQVTPSSPSNNTGVGKPPTKLRGNVLGRLEFEDNNSVIRCLIADQSIKPHLVCPPTTQPLDLSPLPRVERAVQVRRLREDRESRLKLKLQPFIPRFLAEFNRNCLDQNQHKIKH